MAGKMLSPFHAGERLAQQQALELAGTSVWGDLAAIEQIGARLLDYMLT